MTAHVDVAKSLTAHRLREGLNALVRPQPISVLAVEAGRRRLARALLLHRPALSLPDPQPPRAARARRGPRLAHRGAARRRSDAARAQRMLVGTPRFHHLPLGPLPVGQPGEDARPARGQPRRRGNPRRGGGAQLPPPPGALDGRLPGAGRARAMVAGRHAARRSKRATAPRSASTRRRTGSISSRRSTPRPSSRGPAGGFPRTAGLPTEAVSAGAEDGDHVAGLGAGQHDLVAEHVDRGCKAAGDASLAPRPAR